MRSDHYLLPKVLIKMEFLIFPRKIFVYLKLKKKKKKFSKAAWVFVADILLQISNLNWSLSLFEIAVYRFLWFKLFKFCF